jgi:hypothetical protein
MIMSHVMVIKSKNYSKIALNPISLNYIKCLGIGGYR